MQSKILLFIPNFNGGGAEQALINFIKHASENLPSAHIQLVVRNKGGSLADAVPEWLDVVSLELPRSGASTTIKSTLILAKHIRRFKPDVIVGFLSLHTIAVAARLANFRGRLVFSVQNTFRLDVGGNRPITRLKQQAFRWSFNQADACLPLVPAIGKQLHQLFQVEPSRIHVVPNPVDLQSILRKTAQPVDLPQAKQTLITVCRLAEQKRVDILLKAASELRQTCDFQLLILGEGHLHDSLKSMVDNLKLTTTVHFLGFQSNPWHYMHASDIFVLTSEYEGFGNVLIEAMACGLPIVSTDAPFGPRFVTQDGHAGLLVPINEPTQLAEALQTMLSDQKLREQFSQRGLERAQDFAVEKIAHQFWSIVTSDNG